MNPTNTLIFKRLFRFSALIVGLLFFFQPVYAQREQIEKEVLDALTNFEKKDYQKSIPIFEKYEDNLELGDIFKLGIVVNLQSYYFLNKKDAFGISKVNQTVDRYILKKNIGKIRNEKIDDIILIYVAAILNESVENFNKQLEYLSVLKNNYENKNDTLNSNYYAIVLSMANSYFNQANYKEALPLYESVMPKIENILKKNDLTYLNSLENLAVTYLKLGSYNKSFKTSLILSGLIEETFGEKNKTLIRSLKNMAEALDSLGEYKLKISIVERVINIQKEVLGDRNLDYLSSMDDLAAIHSKLNEYEKALVICKEVVKLRNVVQGDHHPDYLMSCYKLGEIYFYLGDYYKALDVHNFVAKIREEILGNHHPDFLVTLNNLGRTYGILGDYKNALNTLHWVTDIGKEALGEDNQVYIAGLNNLGSTYLSIGAYEEAIQVLSKSADLRAKVVGKQDPLYIIVLGNLAAAYDANGDYKKALEINQKVIDLGRDVFAVNSPTYLISKKKLAQTYLHLQEFPKALEIFREVLESQRKILGENHPDFLITKENLCWSEFYSIQYIPALTHLREVLKFEKDNLINSFKWMNGYQRTLLWNQNKRDFSDLLLFVEKVSNLDTQAICDAFDAALFSKGLLLNTTRDFDELIAEKGTPEAIAKFEDLKILKLQIQRLYEKPIAERNLNVDSLEYFAQEKETELVKLSNVYGDYTRNLKINWKDIQSNLEEKDVAIEFVEYPTLSDTIKYVALILRKGWQYPRMISLFRKDQIQEFIKQDKDKVYTNGYVGKQLKKLIWSPLEEVISEGDNVYFSASGILHQLAIENLPANETQTLSEIYHLYRLSSTKELVLKKVPEKNNTAVLYGGLQFDISNEKMLAESKKYEKKENLYAMRGYQSDSTMRKGWGFLEGTLTEVQQINQLMKDSKYTTTYFTGESGSEESFKSLSGKKNDILHIATHGFFLPVEETRKNLFMQQRMGDQLPGKPTADPMLRAGLMLSGGNRAWQGDTIPENIEDGVLTAKEISRMDLRGTDLVVLSACETGLGEVSSEGVFGLQRSFKQAGVQTLLMSLWEVSDNATNYMMTQFYTNLLSGKDKREAFLEAKKSCKEKFPEPQYWAAFIMLD
jgi:CHAT domain-containing protein/pterin-4a-carbinolamine dehydratase